MKLTPRTERYLEDLQKEYQCVCDCGCPALSGMCVGRAVSDPTRAVIVVGEGEDQHMWDLSTHQILEIPKYCPFFGGKERNGG